MHGLSYGRYPCHSLSPPQASFIPTNRGQRDKARAIAVAVGTPEVAMTTLLSPDTNLQLPSLDRAAQQRLYHSLHRNSLHIFHLTLPYLPHLLCISSLLLPHNTHSQADRGTLRSPSLSLPLQPTCTSKQQLDSHCTLTLSLFSDTKPIQLHRAPFRLFCCFPPLLLLRLLLFLLLLTLLVRINLRVLPLLLLLLLKRRVAGQWLRQRRLHGRELREDVRPAARSRSFPLLRKRDGQQTSRRQAGGQARSQAVGRARERAGSQPGTDAGGRIGKRAVKHPDRQAGEHADKQAGERMGGHERHVKASREGARRKLLKGDTSVRFSNVAQRHLLRDKLNL